MEKFTPDEMEVMNYTLQTLRSVIEQELKQIPDGVDINKVVRKLNTIKNLIFKINK
jgi:hypothetical protein